MESVEITRKIEAKELRRLGRLEKSGRVAARMFAIANALDGMSRETSAKLAGMDRQALRDWVHRFNAEGIEGLRDRQRSGRRSKITENDKKKFCKVVEAGPDPKKDKVTRWRQVDLRDWLSKECGATYHKRTVGKLLKRFGYSHMSTRAIHPQNDPVLLEDFKKTSLPKSKPHSLLVPKAKSSNSGSRTKLGSARKAP
jgi:transposase